MTFLISLFPSISQMVRLRQTFGLCRWVENQPLATPKKPWEQEQRSIWHYDTVKLLMRWKKQKPELVQDHSQVLQEVRTCLDLAFKAFFGRVKASKKPGYPRFGGYGRYDGSTCPQSGVGVRHDGMLYPSKIGRDAVGSWQAKIPFEIDPEPLLKSEAVLGIEVGLESFATLSSGDEKEMAKALPKLPKAERGTPDGPGPWKGVQQIHQRTASRLKDFVHKLSRHLVDQNGLIALEKLNGKNMLQEHRLTKSISDAAWHQMVQPFTYKAEYAGREGVLVDPNGTSQRCSGCGMVVKKSLCLRVYSCHRCNPESGRDISVAVNILALGQQCLTTNTTADR